MKGKKLFTKKIWHNIGTMLTVMVIAVGLRASDNTATETAVFTFTGQTGATPMGPVILDPSGNIYSTTGEGGQPNGISCMDGCGVVYQLSPASGSGYTGTDLYRFTGGDDGASPYSGLVRDAFGNLYGTATYSGVYGNGVVFKLSPSSTGTWKFAVIHAFEGGQDGAYPYSQLVLDASGNLYGTTDEGGQYNWGVVFRLSPAAGEDWNETLLYTFTGGSDGGFPRSVILDSAGNLYGETLYGGDTGGANCNPGQAFSGCGVVFKLSRDSGSGWTESVLFTFNGGRDGNNPVGRLLLDASGNLYGVTASGGNLTGCYNVGCGTVYKLSPTASGPWNQTVLLTFQPGASGLGGPGGAQPEVGLTFGADGTLLGTTYAGGNSPSYGGVVFRLSPNSGGTWTETVLHAFSDGTDGGKPAAELTPDRAGNLFGTALIGGDAKCHLINGPGPGCGMVFEITGNP